MNRIKELRKEQGKSLEDIAEAISVGRSTVNRWENEETEPSKRDWESLATYFGVTPGYLIGWSDRKRVVYEKKVKEPKTNLQRLRFEKELKVREVSATLSMPINTILGYENRARKIHPQAAEKFADFYQTNIAFVMDLTNNRDPHLLDDVEETK